MVAPVERTTWVPAAVAALACAIGGASLTLAGAASAGAPRQDKSVSARVQGYELLLTAPVQGGLVGWCMTYRSPHRYGGKCPVIPTPARPILAEAWSSGAAQPVSEAVVLTSPQVAAVSVPGVPSSVQARPQAGLPYGFRAAFLEIPGPQGSRHPHPPITPLNSAGQPIPQPEPRSTPSGYGLPTSFWKSPSHPPAGPCEITSTPLPGLQARWGHVVLDVRSFTGITGRPFLSCVDTQYELRGWGLDAGVVLDATHPGLAPAPLPGMSAVRGHRGVFKAPGWDGELAGRRIGRAWLLVEGGSSQTQRLTVLEHLRATVHP
jgi:hypothetical protein